MPHNSETITVTKTKTATTITEGATSIVSVAAPGKPGPANTLTIGTVTGTVDASANITGIAPNQVLNLNLPHGGTYTHTQGSSATSWTVTHNMGFNPGGVSVVDSSGNVVIGDVQHSSTDELVVSFTGAFSGKAYLS